MYNFIRDFGELPYSQSLLPAGFIPKIFRSKIDFFKYNQLPPIKEEEGNFSEELRNISLHSQPSNERSYRRGYKVHKTNSYDENERKDLIRDGWGRSEASYQSLPPLLNVNCLMNVDIKQQSILNTSFAKRLINGKSVITETMSLPMVKKPKKYKEKLEENSKLLNSSQSFLRNKNIQQGAEDKMTQSKKKKTKPVRVQKQFQKTVEKKMIKKQNLADTGRKNNTFPPTDPTETSIKNSLESLTNTSIILYKPKNHNFLFHCIQNILEGRTPQYHCEYCDEILQAEELDSHKAKHEMEKETCVLCSKVFYNPKGFTQHLLTHASVDKFSCKKCKKYFPSLKKYKIHCKNTHLMSLKSVEMVNVCNTENIKEQTEKYECKRCRLELDSEENLRVHRRNHIRLDLMGAYLLSNKNF